MSLDCSRTVELQTPPGAPGGLTVIEGEYDVPFAIRRVYFLHGMEASSIRGDHAHRTQWQMLIAASGSCEVCLDDGRTKSAVRLDSPARGLLVPPMVWRTLRHFGPGTVVLVLAPDSFDEHDYLRDYGQFILALQP